MVYASNFSNKEMKLTIVFLYTLALALQLSTQFELETPSNEISQGEITMRPAKSEEQTIIDASENLPSNSEFQSQIKLDDGSFLAMTKGEAKASKKAISNQNSSEVAEQKRSKDYKKKVVPKKPKLPELQEMQKRYGVIKGKEYNFLKMKEGYECTAEPVVFLTCYKKDWATSEGKYHSSQIQI